MDAKKIIIFISALIISLTQMSSNTYAQASGMDPKAEVLLTMSAYGTVGGALLGVASMAYGTGFRAVAVGASLGLYAGILFGGYLIGSHYYMRQARVVPQVSSPYSDDGDPDDVGSSFLKSEANYLRYNQKRYQRSHFPPFYMNIFNYTF